MAKHTVKALAHNRVRIDPRFDKLIISLKSATAKDDDFSLDKTITTSLTPLECAYYV